MRCRYVDTNSLYPWWLDRVKYGLLLEEKRTGELVFPTGPTEMVCPVQTFAVFYVVYVE